MSALRLVDTNVIVRYLVQDHAAHARAANGLFEACDRGDLTLVVLPAVVAECVFVLESFYKHSRTDIVRVLSSLISTPGVELAETAIHLEALDRYRRSKVHFVDCVLAATAANGDIPVASLDNDFRKFADVRVELDP
jgi:predicted nucleic acid-binding protein